MLDSVAASTIRSALMKRFGEDFEQVVSELLYLPDRAFPIAGLCVGWPAQPGEITPRLSLQTTVIADGYSARDLAAEIDADRCRAALRPYRRQRNVGGKITAKRALVIIDSAFAKKNSLIRAMEFPVPVSRPFAGEGC
jgi:hypothetical protein